MKITSLLIAVALFATISFAQVDNLKSRLNKQKEESLKSKTPEQINDLQKVIDELSHSKLFQNQLLVGDPAIDFTLKDINGKKVNLYSILDKKHVILVFFRGSWCPYCNIELSYYQSKIKEIEALGGTVIAVSPQKSDISKEMAMEDSIKFPIVYDDKAKVSKAYKLVYDLDETAKKYYSKIDFKKYYGTDSKQLPLTATFLVNKDRSIRYKSVTADHRQRGDADLIIRILGKFGTKQPKN